jgi:hypothetical protein
MDRGIVPRFASIRPLRVQRRSALHERRHKSLRLHTCAQKKPRNRIELRTLFGDHPSEGVTMARPELQDAARARMYIPVARARYVVILGSGGWVIPFDGDEYGPYTSRREALLFAIEAAHKLGKRGENAAVLVADTTGDPRPVWTSGHDRFPPDL